MKISAIALAILCCFIATAQDIQEFTCNFTESADVRLGKDWDYSYTQLGSPLTVVLKDNLIKGTLANGKVWGEFKVIAANLVEDKGTEKCYNLVVDNKGNLETWIYNINGKSQELIVPLIVKGQVFQYVYYQ